jgi:hypothetical protein
MPSTNRPRAALICDTLANGCNLLRHDLFHRVPVMMVASGPLLLILGCAVFALNHWLMRRSAPPTCAYSRTPYRAPLQLLVQFGRGEKVFAAHRKPPARVFIF